MGWLTSSRWQYSTKHFMRRQKIRWTRNKNYNLFVARWQRTYHYSVCMDWECATKSDKNAQTKWEEKKSQPKKKYQNIVINFLIEIYNRH